MRGESVGDLIDSVFNSLRPDASFILAQQPPLLLTVSWGIESETFDLDPDDSPSTTVYKAADRLQTIFMEATHTMLPPCSEHLGEHPLIATLTEDDVAFWQCPINPGLRRTIIASTPTA